MASFQMDPPSLCIFQQVTSKQALSKGWLRSLKNVALLGQPSFELNVMDSSAYPLLACQAVAAAEFYSTSQTLLRLSHCWRLHARRAVSSAISCRNSTVS